MPDRADWGWVVAQATHFPDVTQGAYPADEGCFFEQPCLGRRCCLYYRTSAGNVWRGRAATAGSGELARYPGTINNIHAKWPVCTGAGTDIVDEAPSDGKTHARGGVIGHGT